MSKNSNDPQNNLLNNAQIGYYDENGNFIQGGYYDEEGNFISGSYYDENGNLIQNGHTDQEGNFIPGSNGSSNDNLTPAGYYDTNGFFIITGYYDQNGNYVEDNSYSSNNINNEPYNQGENFGQFNNQTNNFQGNNYNDVDNNIRTDERASEKVYKKKKSKLRFIVPLLLVCIIATGLYYFKFYKKDDKVVHLDQYKVELVAYGTNRNGKVDVNITEVPEVKDADENIKKFLRKPEVKYSPKENLENGSKVDVEITLNKEEVKKKGLQVTGSFKRTLTVTGLSEENSSKKEEKKSTSNTLWNKEKSNKLYQYVKEWEKTLNQNYKEYTIDKKVNYNGLHLPGDTEKVGQARLVLEGDKLINMKWSPEGNIKDVYNIVAVYSDIENVRGPASHLYYFTILNGEPIVLVTEQNQGNDKKYLYFKRTANVYLQEEFEKIVKGE